MAFSSLTSASRKIISQKIQAGKNTFDYALETWRKAYEDKDCGE